MVSKKRLHYEDDSSYSESDSDSSGGETELNRKATLVSTPKSAVTPSKKSPLKSDSKHATSEAGEGTPSRLRRRKKKQVSPYFSNDSKRIWNKEDEIAILKGIADYQNEAGVIYNSDTDSFFNYMKNVIHTKFSKEQLMSKTRKLKKRFQDNMLKVNAGKEPCFANSFDSECFALSKILWGNHDKAEGADMDMDKAKESRSRSSRSKSKSRVMTPVEHEEMTNGNPKDDGPAEGHSTDNLPSDNVDNEAEKSMENGACGKKKEEDDGADELRALQDALETTMFLHLGDYPKSMLLQNLKTLGAKERKKLSDEWKSLVVQEMLLKSKKQAFSAKLAEAAVHE